MVNLDIDNQASLKTGELDSSTPFPPEILGVEYYKEWHHIAIANKKI